MYILKINIFIKALAAIKKMFKCFLGKHVNERKTRKRRRILWKNQLCIESITKDL